MKYTFTIKKNISGLSKVGKKIYTYSLFIEPCFTEYFPTSGNYFLTLNPLECP
jgi:hypothetical protein